MVSRIGNLSLFTSTFRNLANVQENLATLQRQVSGERANDFEGLNGQVEQFTFLEARLRQTNRFIENNQISVSRLNTAGIALTQTTELLDQAENLFVQRRNPAFENDLNFGQQIRNLAISIANELNVRFEGRSLFGGSNTNDVPIPDPFFPQHETGVPDDGYYAGSKENTTYRADERVDFEFPVRADDIAFQKLFAAINQGLAADVVDDDEGIANALNLLQEAQEDLNAAQARVNSNIVILEQINERHSSTSIYLKGVTESISRTDVVAVSIEIANNEAILQAGYQAFARITQLRLSDFL